MCGDLSWTEGGAGFLQEGLYIHLQGETERRVLYNGKSRLRKSHTNSRGYSTRETKMSKEAKARIKINELQIKGKQRSPQLALHEERLGMSLTLAGWVMLLWPSIAISFRS